MWLCNYRRETGMYTERGTLNWMGIPYVWRACPPQRFYRMIFGQQVGEEGMCSVGTLPSHISCRQAADPTYTTVLFVRVAGSRALVPGFCCTPEHQLPPSHKAPACSCTGPTALSPFCSPAVPRAEAHRLPRFPVWWVKITIVSSILALILLPKQQY